MDKKEAQRLLENYIFMRDVRIPAIERLRKQKWVVTQMKAKELFNLSAGELDQQLASLKEELFNLRFQLATGQLDNPMKIRDVKKNIARVKTIQRQQELKAAQG